MTNPKWDPITSEAARLVHGPRQATYQHPRTDYERTAALFAEMTGIYLTAREAVLFMVCVKMSRIAAAHEQGFTADVVRDSIVDAAGYLDCAFAVWDEDPEEELALLLDGAS